MEDYIISQDLLKEMQQDGLIDTVTDDIEPKPQPLPSNEILSDTKKMINTQINNNKNNINYNKSSLIPEVSESQENAESFSFNYNSSSIGKINYKNETKINKQLNNKNDNLIKEEDQEEENIDESISNNDNNYYNNSNYKNEEENYIEAKEKENNSEKEGINRNQSSFTSFGRPQTDYINTSISTFGIEPLYYKTNDNLKNGSLTPINQSKIKYNFNKSINNNKNNNNYNINNQILPKK